MINEIIYAVIICNRIVAMNFKPLKFLKMKDLQENELRRMYGGGILDTLNKAYRIYQAAKRIYDSLGKPQA